MGKGRESASASFLATSRAVASPSQIDVTPTDRITPTLSGQTSTWTYGNWFGGVLFVGAIPVYRCWELPTE